jgi:hypothetical protein
MNSQRMEYFLKLKFFSILSSYPLCRWYSFMKCFIIEKFENVIDICSCKQQSKIEFMFLWNVLFLIYEIN